MALLLAEGFTVDTRAADTGWYVRDDSEWVLLGNIATARYNQARDFSQPPDEAEGFQVVWTTDPTRIVGYCVVILPGGEGCLTR